MKKVIVITGPTASGKTGFSLNIASKLNSEIINCDASQFRRDLNIGTAKIDLKQTNIPHHLIDFLDPETEFSIKEFQVLARQKIADLHRRSLIPILVGGSGLYINVVLGDYDLSIKKRNPDLEKELELLSNFELHQKLTLLDPNTAQTIHQNNRRRVLRAIEASLSGKKISENKSGGKLLYDALILCLNLDRELLYQRINERTTEMINSGWLEEIRSLLEAGIDFTKIKDIGYQELANYLLNGGRLEAVLDDIRRQTRNYAKRQITWFKNKMDCQFINVNHQKPKETEEQINNIIDFFLANAS